MLRREYYSMDAQLKSLYSSWLEEMNTLQKIMLDDMRYSNPYYACVPKGWIEAPVRILIVGEEGAGCWGRGKAEGIKSSEIANIQQFCWNSLASYLHYNLDYELYPNGEAYSVIKSPFWNRARKISKFGICAWTNIDKLHICADKKCALTYEERIKLHSTKIRLLNGEIAALKPTHVVFFGWYGVSLKHELPDVFKELYPGDLGDNSLWKNNVVAIEKDDIHYIFCYHPNWGIRQKGYEDKVLAVLKSTLDWEEAKNV